MHVYLTVMLDSNSKAARLFVLLLAIGASACGADNDKSNPVPVKDAGVDAPSDAPSDAKADAPSDAAGPADSGVEQDAADASDQ